jgi:hypothetical protein
MLFSLLLYYQSDFSIRLISVVPLWLKLKIVYLPLRLRMVPLQPSSSWVCESFSFKVCCIFVIWKINGLTEPRAEEELCPKEMVLVEELFMRMWNELF